MEIGELTPESEALRILGERLARIRKQQGFSQTRLAEHAGIGVATLRRIEAGKDSQLGSWIKLLKSLQRVSLIDGLVPDTFESPMAEALASKKRWRRQSRSTGPVWGDQIE